MRRRDIRTVTWSRGFFQPAARCRAQMLETYRRTVAGARQWALASMNRTRVAARAGHGFLFSLRHQASQMARSERSALSVLWLMAPLVESSHCETGSRACSGMRRDGWGVEPDGEGGLSSVWSEAAGKTSSGEFKDSFMGFLPIGFVGGGILYAIHVFIAHNRGQVPSQPFQQLCEKH